MVPRKRPTNPARQGTKVLTGANHRYRPRERSSSAPKGIGEKRRDARCEASKSDQSSRFLRFNEQRPDHLRLQSSRYDDFNPFLESLSVNGSAEKGRPGNREKSPRRFGGCGITWNSILCLGLSPSLGSIQVLADGDRRARRGPITANRLNKARVAKLDRNDVPGILFWLLAGRVTDQSIGTASNVHRIGKSEN